MKSKGDQTVFVSSEENNLLARLVHRDRISRFHTFSTWPSAIYSLHQQKLLSWMQYSNEKLQCWLLLHALMRFANDTEEGTYVILRRRRTVFLDAEFQALSLQISVQDVGPQVSCFVDTTDRNSLKLGHWIQCIKCSTTPSKTRLHKRLWKIHLWKTHGRKISGIKRTAHW
jgi:hypothetical protein